MSEMDLERPVDDSFEQNQDAIPDGEELDEEASAHAHRQ